MSALELQEQLISKIQITTDEDILEGVLRFLEFETEENEIYTLNEIQKLAITQAQQQVANGEFYTDEQVDKLTEKWLKRVIWSHDAYNDKVQIYSYWNARNKSTLYSRKLNRLFSDTIKSILNNPTIGRKTNIENVKRIIARDYFIIYEESETTLIILRIWDSRQNPQKLIYNTD